MLCPNCTKTIPDESKFCLECGSNLSSISGDSATEPDLSIGMWPTIEGIGRKGDDDDGRRELHDPHDVSHGPTLVGQGDGGHETSIPGSPHKPLAERYDVLGEVGRGGFGVVYQARDRKLDRVIAVKRLATADLHGRQGQLMIERFTREARVIASLNHRNIVQVFDHDRDADGCYIVMEYIEAGTLAQYLKAQGPLPVHEAIDVIKGICQGLACAHRKNLVHRDVKPSNILLAHEDDRLVPKIVDFGLARAGLDSSLSSEGYGMGTEFYMPPEQRRDAKTVNHTADVYAVGKTLYAMLTGEIPDTVDPSKLPPPAELATIIFKCVKTRPEERYFSMDDLQRDLDSLGVGRTTSSAPLQATPAKNVCPNCNHANGDDVKFCERCGTGLYRVCPECERENSVHIKFCGGCGTDAEAFLRVQDAVQRMEAYRKEKNWSRVVKEFEIVPTDVRLPGEKGRQVNKSLQELYAEGQRSLSEIDELKKGIDESVSCGEFQQARTLVERLQELDSSSIEINELSERLPALIEEQLFQNATQNARQLEADGVLEEAVNVYESYVAGHGQSKFALQASREIERLRRDDLKRKLNRAKGEAELLEESRDFAGAIRLYRQFASSDALPDDVENVDGEIQRLLIALVEADAATAFESLDRVGNSRHFTERVHIEQMPFWHEAATLGIPAGQWLLGDCYLEGIGVEKDRVEAERCFALAAQQNFAGAQATLGQMCLADDANETTRKQGFELIRKAAEQGLCLGQSRLASIYSKGEIVPKDLEKAVEWLQKAVDQGSPSARLNLGMMYLETIRGPQSVAKGVELISAAAQDGLIRAQYELAQIYHRGDVVVRDSERAYRWYRKAANQGHPTSQFAVGYYLENGLGGAKANEAQAIDWYQKAADNGFERAITRLKEMGLWKKA